MEDLRHGDSIIGGVRRPAENRIDVRNAFDDALVGTIARGTPVDVADAVTAAAAAQRRPFPAHERYDVLMRVADRIDEERQEYTSLIAREGSKTITEAARSPSRAASIYRLAADASRRVTGETLPFDIRPGSEARSGYFVLKPAGVVAAIMPFNDPMAVAAHKIGPALAAGNSVVLKPDSKTPFTALAVAELFAEAGLPPGRLNIVTGHGSEIGDALVSDPRVRVVAFTGGLKTGERITRTAGIKKLLLELGANSPVIVMGDADIESAASAIVAGAFAQAGQNCLGVQRVFVHVDIAPHMISRLVSLTSSLKAGHSLDASVDVCQMIRKTDADRVAAWVAEAVDGGAEILTGGRQTGAVFEPTILKSIPSGARLECQEVYGPVLGIYPVHTLEEAVERANGVEFGLHAAIFTESLRQAFYATEHLNAGAVIVNDSTDYRLDSMPFGGIGNSGIGREGIRFATEAMTETRVVCFNL